MKLRLLLSLIGCNVIWGLNPGMGKLVMRDFTPMQTSWLRYASATISLWIFAAFVQIFWKEDKRFALGAKYSWNLWKWLITLGVVTFFISPVVQYSGLSKSSASANSLVVAIEPMFCVLWAWILLKETISLKQWGSIALSLLGFAMLSRIDFGELTDRTELLGNLLLLATMPCEAMHTIVSRAVKGRVNGFSLTAYTLTLGIILFSFYVGLLPEGLPDLTKLTWTSLLGVLWMGPLVTTFGYTYWTIALGNAPVAPVVLTLLVQPITGTLYGYYALGERLSWLQFAGGLIIIIALLSQTDFRETK